VFWRGLGRLLFLPPLWMLLHGKGPRAFLEAGWALGTQRILLGTVLYTIQNVAFILAVEMTYVASVLAIIATGPLWWGGASLNRLNLPLKASCSIS
jgi:drug/metabolite transporter (DMT)-like permease